MIVYGFVRNLLITGAGRSGTSLVAGMLAGAGYHAGDDFLAPTRANPKGFFEDSRVTAINDGILQAQFPYWLGPRIAKWSPRLSRVFYRWVPDPSQLWLAGLSTWRAKPATREFDDEIRALLIEPYCYKDPRFYFTLPVWRPFLQNVGIICVFRSPERTAESITRECAESSYLASLGMTRRKALRIWENTYRWILEHQATWGDWLFIHFNQALTQAGMERIEAFAGAQVDRAFGEERLSRSKSDHLLRSHTYQKLCALAGFEERADQ